jgi:hypothetical protein
MLTNGLNTNFNQLQLTIKVDFYWVSLSFRVVLIGKRIYKNISSISFN